MKKEGFGDILGSKDGRIYVMPLVAAVLIFFLMVVFVNSVGVSYLKPENNEINTSNSRNINFTFTPTWNNTGEVISNCSLWTNFTGTWQSEAEFNGTNEANIWNGSANISNGTLSWINYTFKHDLGNFVWTVACRNGTGTNAELNFSAGNRTIAIDTVAPRVVQTAQLFAGFNTTSTTPTINFNLTDVNGTGVNLTQNGTINISILDVSAGADTLIRADSYGIDSSLSNITCGAADGAVGVTSAQCTLTISGTPLSNGTKNITITVTDRAGLVNITSLNITIDQIPPALIKINLTNSSQLNDADGVDVINGTGSGSLRQGQKIYLTVNLTDNLTQPRNISFQWLNMTSGTAVWMEVNATSTVATSARADSAADGRWGNATFTIPTGRNEFEGRNVSFRVVYNDTLGNGNTSLTQIVQINDTYAPTVSIPNGTIVVNGTNTTVTAPTISWLINENNQLTRINVSVDRNTHGSTGVDSNCKLSAIYTTAAGPNNVERNRNGTFTVSSDATCTLGNGTHFVNITAVDIWGNTVTLGHTFTVQSGNVPALVFSNIIDVNGQIVTNPSVSTVNNSNLTSKLALNFSGLGGSVSIANLSYVSSCNSSSTVYFTNNTAIFPFNSTSDVACGTTSANRTLKVTVTDTAGNSNSTVFGFMVDNVVPTITVHSPTDGQTFADITSVNVSAFDSGSQIQWIAYYLDGVNILINHTMNGSRLTDEIGQNSSNTNRTINFTAGTHRIKISVNDTLGNIANTSEITFVQTGPVTFGSVRSSIENYSILVYSANMTNVTVRIKTGTGYETVSTPNETSTNTFEIYFEMNGTSGSDYVNLSLTEINGSAVNWQRINFTPIINDTQTEGYITTNWTVDVLRAVIVNNSLAEFITNNNSYYGIVILPVNITNGSNIGTALAQEFWWIPDAAAVTTRFNISKCDGGFSTTTTSPCWNYTSSGRTAVQVPYFGAVVAVNDSSTPTVNVTTPSPANQTTSMFVPNITVSSDTASCLSSLNSTISNVTMTKSGNVCLGQTERFKNLNSLDGNYNFTFTVTDTNGNINRYVWEFNVTDAIAPNNGAITSSPDVTTATVTITGTNESVNATVNYGTVNTSLSSTAVQTDFNVTQDVSITGLTASTVYYYNVTVCDFNGNCKTNLTVFSFTTSAAASTAAAASSSSSSGGGGGVVAPSAVAASTSRSWDTLAADSTGTFKVSSGSIAFTNIVIAVVNAVSNPTVGVSSLTSNPQSSAPSDKVYQYLEITHSNIADGDISKATISFKVPKSWLSANGVAEGDIVLYRYNSGQWNALSTTITSSDADNVWFEAVSPGFSDYAIGSKAGAITPTTPETTPAEQPAETTPATPTPAEQPAETTQQPAESEPASKNTLAWIVVAIIVIVAALGFVMWQKKKSQD